MTTTTLRNLRLASGAAWFLVGAYGVRGLVVRDGGDWELPYNVFALALLVGVVFTVVGLVAATRDAVRPRLRALGLAVSLLGIVMSLVAWAVPVWTTLLGVGFTVLAGSSPDPLRRTAGLLAAAQFAGSVTALLNPELALAVTGAAMGLGLMAALGPRLQVNPTGA